jgi:hypothetical protein
MSAFQSKLEDDYDHIVLVASDYYASYSQSDARTIVAYMLLEEVLAGRDPRPSIVVELMDSDNRALLDRRDVDVVVSPLVIGRVLAHVAVRPELHCAYNELLDAEGPCIEILDASAYDVTRGEHSFKELSLGVEAYGDVLLGILPSGPTGPLTLNAVKTDRFDVGDRTLLVVIGH